MHVSRETFEHQYLTKDVKWKLSVFSENLIRWSKSINLISNHDNIYNRHFLDSAQLITYIDNYDSRIIDLGTGAGFPGIVLSILGCKSVVLVEKNKKKASFLRHLIYELDLSAKVAECEVQDIEANSADIVTSRALSSLSKLLKYSKNIVKSDGYALFLKGKKYNNEIIQAQKKWSFDFQIFLSISSCHGRIIKVKNIKTQ